MTLNLYFSGQEEVILKGVSKAGLEAVINFAYTGQLELSPNSITDILLAATHLQFPEAIVLCSRYLSYSTNFRNTVEMYMLAEQFNLVPLQEKALDLILYQFEGIATDQDDFLKMNHTMFAKILQDNRLRISSELKLYELVLKWLNHDRADREQHLDLLMSNVRLPLIKPQQLVEKVMVEPIMKVNEKCLELILEANTYHMLPMKQPVLQSRRTQVRSDVPSLIMLDTDDEGPRVLDLLTSSWATLQTTPLETFHAQVCTIDNYMYVCGGIELYSTNNPVSGRSYRYDPRFDSLTDIAAMQEPRHHFTLISDGRSLFAIGGYCSGTYKNAVEKYLVEEDRWVAKTSLDVKLSAAASAMHEGKIYVSGGQTDRGISRCMWCYDIQLDRWIGKDSLLQPRMDHGMCCYKDKLYVIGGYDKNIIKAYDIDSIECYDVKTNQWSLLAEGCPRLSGIASCLIGSRVYMVGGFTYDDNKKRKEVMSYDIENDEWHVVAHLHTPAMSVPCCALSLPRNLLCSSSV